MSDREWKFAQFDATLTATDEPRSAVEVAEATVAALRQKGFCVLNAKARIEALGEGEELHKEADREVRMLEESGRFERQSPQVVQGLLGDEGSTAVCELGPDDEEAEVAPAVQRLGKIMDTVFSLLAPTSEAELGLAVGGRTAGLLHIAGEDAAAEEDEEGTSGLTEAEADKWLSLFVNGRYMLLLCLGPGKGHLELHPFRHEDTPLHVVSTEPGTLVIVRSDTLTQRYYSYERSVVLTSWLAQTMLPEQRADAGADEEVLNPAARGLMQWISDRLRFIKEREKYGPDGAIYDTELPREWQCAMNHTFLKGGMTTCSLRGMSCKFPGTWDPYSSFAPLTLGVDMATTVPMMRWKHEDVFNEDMEGWKYFKSYARHGMFMEGGELFDPKPFGLAVYEAKGMDPCQRHILECSYEALLDATFSKKQLMRSLIGVYIGAAQTEFVMAENCNEGVGTSCSGAITSNRISFCLGLQGPSYTSDLGGASSLAAVTMAMNSLRFQTDLYKSNHTAVPGSVNLMLAPQYYVLACAAGFLSQTGRSQTFDVTAAGYARGEGTAAAVITPFAPMVDGIPVRDESRPWHGNLSSCFANHVGQTAGLTSPSGPRETEMIAELIRQAAISPLDVDLAECWGESGILSDAVAVKALTNGLRIHHSEDWSEAPVLGLSSVGTGFGFMHESMGMAQLFKAVFGAKYNLQVPGLHLQELNPHIDAWDGEPLNFHTEAVAFKHVSSFTDVGSKSVSGTVSHVLAWGEVDLKKHTPRKRWKGEAIAFWPAGGGELAEGAEPKRNYYIAGSWSTSEWTEPEPMKLEEEGVYSYVLTLGADCRERFQIWLDGNDQRVLHPGMADGPLSLPVQGPDDAASSVGSVWLIDGRARSVVAVPTLTDGAEGTALQVADDADLSPPEGSPGDTYRVRLQVAGKWRTVDWKLLERAESSEVRDDGKYYVLGSWSDWSFSPMRSEASEPGLYILDLALTAFSGEFQIVRNRDWFQVFSPADEDPERVEGPEAGREEACWSIPGLPGQKFRVEFRRTWKDGQEERSVSWRSL